MSIVAQTPRIDTVLLDIYSTSQTFPSRCVNRAPHICIPPAPGQDGKLLQGCCNSWQCPRCGELRAKQEYRRIIEGVRTLAASYPLFFQTLTCTVGEPQQQAESTYLARTNKFLTNFRKHVKQQSPAGAWHYVQVTERQHRGHPHSHLITTFAPSDAFTPVLTDESYARYLESIARINSQVAPEMRFTATRRADMSFLELHSEWMMLAAVKAGLGVQVNISEVDSFEAASRYIAKYLFKSLIETEMPKNWRRVRYSQGFPKLPEAASTSAFPLVRPADWIRAGELPGTIICFNQATYEHALLMRCYNVALASS